MNYFRIGRGFEGHLEQLYDFVDKEILSSERFSPLSRVTQKSVAELKWQFNSSDSRYVSFYSYCGICSIEFKTRMYIMTVWFALNENTGTEYLKSKLSSQVRTLDNQHTSLCVP